MTSVICTPPGQLFCLGWGGSIGCVGTLSFAEEWWRGQAVALVEKARQHKEASGRSGFTGHRSPRGELAETESDLQGDWVNEQEASRSQCIVSEQEQGRGLRREGIT
jgi:hypothetical protein